MSYRVAYVARRRRAGGAGRTKGRGPATPAGAWGSAPHPPISQSANQPISHTVTYDLLRVRSRAKFHHVRIGDMTFRDGVLAKKC